MFEQGSDRSWQVPDEWPESHRCRWKRLAASTYSGDPRGLYAGRPLTVETCGPETFSKTIDGRTDNYWRWSRNQITAFSLCVCLGGLRARRMQGDPRHSKVRDHVAKRYAWRWRSVQVIRPLLRTRWTAVCPTLCSNNAGNEKLRQQQNSTAVPVNSCKSSPRYWKRRTTHSRHAER
jgi:hypothetical protein